MNNKPVQILIALSVMCLDLVVPNSCTQNLFKNSYKLLTLHMV